MQTQWLGDNGQFISEPYAQGLIDEGELFVFSSGLLTANAVGTDITRLFRISEGYHSHMQINVLASSDIVLYVFENPSITSSGVSGSPVNFNRTIDNGMPHSTVYGNAVLATTGTTLWRLYIPSGAGKFGGGGAEQVIGAGWQWGNEYPYAVRIEPLAAGSFNLSMSMHEHIDE